MLRILILLATLASSAHADILADARTILDAHQGKVLKWGYTPTIAVIHDGQFDFDYLDDVLTNIRRETKLDIVTAAVKRVDINQLEFPFVGNSNFRLLRGARSDPKDRLGRLTLGRNPPITADLFIFHVPVLEGSYFNLLSVLANGKAGLPRQYAEGGHCYFSMVGNKGRTQQARVFIGTNLTKKGQQDCIYEEVMQTMGLANDAEGSSHFTFDGQVGFRDRTNDYLLLRALYDPSIAHGGPVANVVTLFDRLRDE